MNDQPPVACVIPVYNEQEILDHCYERVAKMLDSLDQLPREIVFANDGSIDQTNAILLQFAQQDPRVVVIRLTRNFEHQTTVAAGLPKARGEMIAVRQKPMHAALLDDTSADTSCLTTA